MLGGWRMARVKDGIQLGDDPFVRTSPVVDLFVSPSSPIEFSPLGGACRERASWKECGGFSFQ